MEHDDGSPVPYMRSLLFIHAPTDQTKKERQNPGYNRNTSFRKRQTDNSKSLASHWTLKVPITIARDEELVPEVAGLGCLLDERLHGDALLGDYCRSSRSTPATRKIQLCAGWLTEVHTTPARFLVQHGFIFCG